VIPLDLALSKISNAKLAKELAYCLCTDASQRMKLDRYNIAFNLIALKDWSSIAVVKTSISIKEFKDIVCVDFSIYNDKEFHKKNCKFLSLVLFELNQLRKI